MTTPAPTPPSPTPEPGEVPSDEHIDWWCFETVGVFRCTADRPHPFGNCGPPPAPVQGERPADVMVNGEPVDPVAFLRTAVTCGQQRQRGMDDPSRAVIYLPVPVAAAIQSLIPPAPAHPGGEQPVATWPPSEMLPTDRYLPMEQFVAGAISTLPPFDQHHPQYALPHARHAIEAIGEFDPDDADRPAPTPGSGDGQDPR